MNLEQCLRLLRLTAVLVSIVHSLCGFAPAQDDEEEPEFLPGIVARYSGPDGTQHVRLDREIAFDWDRLAPTRLVGPDGFHVRWHGNLRVPMPGVYRLKAYALGKVELKLAGHTILDATAAEPRWLDAKPLEISFGFQPLEVNFTKTGERARLALFWSGPQFQLEPIAERWLFHPSAEKVDDRFERGELLAHALRCAACHKLPGGPASLRGPALDRLSGNISRGWLVDWLIGTTAGGPAKPQDPSPQTEIARRMPHFGFEREEASAVAEYLTSFPPPPAPKPSKASDKPGDGKIASEKKPGKKSKSSVVEPPAVNNDPPTGATLLRSVGCLACHRVGELGAQDAFGGGDLTSIARKRPSEFFSRWLTRPEELNADHRMPVFRLTADEIGHLAAYLKTLGEPARDTSRAGDVNRERGRKLVAEHRCALCHTLPEKGNDSPRAESIALARPQAGCLGEPDAKRQRPGYRLPPRDREALETFLRAIGELKAPTQAVKTGELVLAERNCLACHARGGSRGMIARLGPVAEADPRLREVLPAMSPPALFGVGDKLQDESLRAAITVSRESHRPWLRVRMPRFPMPAAEVDALVEYLIDTDRIPDLPATDSTLLDPRVAQAAGARLVTADGFGCTSCHTIGTWEPVKVALNARGPDLAMMSERLRRPWYDRWMRNPARIVPQMEMPAVQLPIRGVLEGRVESQLDAAWQALNVPGFNPPPPNALRVVRSANLPEVRERANVLTDIIEVGATPFVKPLVIGLPNRHNVLFDFASNRMAAWWTGDTARQRTRGKSWYWEAAGTQLLASPSIAGDDADESEFTLVALDEVIEPVDQGQFPAELDSCEILPDGARFSYRLRFRFGVKHLLVNVTQAFRVEAPVARTALTGVRRRVEISGLAPHVHMRLRVLPTGLKLTQQNRREVNFASPSASGNVQFEQPAEGEIEVRDDVALATPFTSRLRDRVVFELVYRTDLPVDQFAPAILPDRSVTKETFDVVPGFEAVRLPVTDEVMPTGLAWTDRGQLVMCSLNDKVFFAKDADGDGLEDHLEVFADGLSAPYGLAARGDAVDVINKYALVRLEDLDRDGRADRMTTLASGWGHTLDYHDWAVGLPRDEAGNYYVALPCQQDDRASSAVALRGSIIKLSPRPFDDADPRQFAIEPIAAGLRFPMGLARNRAGEMFCTDNQGHYTPFNELNHIVKGERYGFLNRWEVKAGLNPPYMPASIEIPHPWTRSVNGICFLETPPNVKTKAANRKLFGPFEGHLIGCEYDSRRLVRMSLDRVGDVVQGAVYPLSAPPPLIDGVEAGPTFEGPLVCQVSPKGDVYIGNIRDSGWGAGSNTGSLVRLRRQGDLPPGIAEVPAAQRGFTVEFTQPINASLAANPASYGVESYRRIPTPSYGGSDKDRRVEKIKRVHVAEDHQSATLELDDLRAGFVYEFRVRNLAIGEKRFFPDEAYYTLRKTPQ